MPTSVQKTSPKHEEIYKEYKEIFKEEITETNICKAQFHKIDTADDQPGFQKNFRVPMHFETPISEEIDKNLRLGIIRPSNSPWCSRIVPVTKPDVSLRMCIDYLP
ncbi:Retrovirus-related Pol polyprotein from transposon [Nosema granulosis]|uniref:Retrovirus-related Pol polyprotein from transposon n=1 Tax=Nosema granulosis TaxID=83296 RepID=A0A9P6KXQ0_9MICR|nr:Retrovirus-related Pol polyprotein from transposon [Nosema granulosis]